MAPPPITERRYLRRDPRAALLVDSAEQPYRSVQFGGTVRVADEATEPEEIARLYERYLERRRTLDFGKLAA